MPIRISQIDERESDGTILRVEGSLRLEDAELLEQLCRDLRERSERSLVIDLSCLTFLDSDSASVLCRLKAQPGITLAGLHLFTRQMIEGRQDARSLSQEE
jgi:anti-anti-sigma regulatory factor